MSNTPGLNLADLAPLSEDVMIGDQPLTVYGVSVKSGLEIFKRFPSIANMLTGGGFDLGAFLIAAPDAVAAIIAAATGNLGNERAEENAAALGVEVQLDILEAVGRLTFTKGFGPFAQRVMSLANSANSSLSSKGMDTNLPPALKPSLPPDIAQT